MAVRVADIVQRAFEAVDREDKEALFRLLRPGVEWQMLGLLSDSSPMYRGREEIWAYVRSLHEDIEGFRSEIVEMTEIGAQVVARVRVHGRPAGGRELDFEFSTLMRVEDGRIARADNYEDHEEALTDAGLRLGKAG
jgi:ketosteroid isomerase-like protein